MLRALHLRPSVLISHLFHSPLFCPLYQTGFGGYGVLVKLFAQGASVNAVVFSFFRDLGCFPVLLTAAVSIKLKPIDTCGRVGVWACGRVREALVPRHTVLAGGTERQFQLCIYSCKCAWRSLVKLDPSKGMENNNSERPVSRAYTCIYVVNMKRSPSTPIVNGRSRVHIRAYTWSI